MAQSPLPITNWFEEGVKQGHDYMIMVNDTFGRKYYPVYASAAEIQEKVKAAEGGSCKVEEVFDLRLSMTRIYSKQVIRDDRVPHLMAAFGITPDGDG